MKNVHQRQVKTPYPRFLAKGRIDVGQAIVDHKEATRLGSPPLRDFLIPKFNNKTQTKK